ncbi:CapA family protein [Chloroflexi bacterium TSY]|nr:CapA family protein [Chloroflexi bacterium TSY]
MIYMWLDKLPRKFTLLISGLMISLGMLLGVWAMIQMLIGSQFTGGEATASVSRSLVAENPPTHSIAPALHAPTSSDLNADDSAASDPMVVVRTAANPTATETSMPRLTIQIDSALEGSFRQKLNQLELSRFDLITKSVAYGQVNQTTINESSARISTLVVSLKRCQGQSNGQPFYEQIFAAASRFDTIGPSITLANIRELWGASTENDRAVALDFEAISVLTNTLPALNQLLGKPGILVFGFDTVDEVIAAARSDQPTLVLLPFEELHPILTVMTVDGQNPVENTNKFDPRLYPLAVTYFAHRSPMTKRQEAELERLIEQLPTSNRNPQRLTVIAMTGVTAMVRQTAARMDQFGATWPAAVVGSELAKADITHISNEVPFVEGCETNISADNLIFCSKPEYLDALMATGVDIIGLTGNHQNDYGREEALNSLEFYADAQLPVYGGGRNKEEAFAPFYLEHNGNRLAFLGANSYGPRFAWATDNAPGSAEFDLAIMSATIRSIKEKDLADVVLAEVQYQESYGVTPLFDQRQNFTALVRAGADIVTGVQSHVPQAMEFTHGKLILYGLGNLFFDQMYSNPTREGLIVKHTIYEGRHLSTQILTTMLHEYGQPRWATPEERRRILNRVFSASYWE